MTRPVIIVDTETTGLDPERHEIWEIGTINRSSGREHQWRMKPDLSKADPQALSVGRYYERTSGMCGKCRPDRAYDLVSPYAKSADPEWSCPPVLAAEVARLLDGAILVAANPALDAGFLSAFLRANGEAPTWHYRLRDIGSMAHGFLMHNQAKYEGLPLDSSTDTYAELLGVDSAAFDRHSALGDCRLAGAMLDVIESGDAS
jgi:DNA polymerase III epsilon subunit-like protein